MKEPQAPEVDDEFAKDVSEFETLADFRKDLGDKLAKRREEQAQQDFENQVMDQLLENMECEIPDGMIEVQVDKVLDDYAMRLQSQGLSLDDYMKMVGMTPDMMRASVRPSAARQVQVELALTAVAEAEGLEASQEELDAEVKRLSEQYNLSEEQVKAAVPEEELKRELRLKKASDLVIAEAKVGKAPKKKAAKKEEGEGGEASSEEKPKRTRKKKTDSAEEPQQEPEAAE